MFSSKRFFNRFRSLLRKIASRSYCNSIRIILFQFGGVDIGQSTNIARFVTINENVKIGNNVSIEADTAIGPDVKMGDGVRIRVGSTLSNILLGDNVIIGEKTHLSYASIGSGTFIEYGVTITGFGRERVRIGRDSYIGIYCVLDRSGKLNIGDNVGISNSVGIWTHSGAHMCILGINQFRDEEKETKRVNILSNTYIGGNTTIYPGVDIGPYSMVLPNSAVDKKVQAYTLVGGCPIKLLRRVRIAEDKMVLSFVKVEQE